MCGPLRELDNETVRKYHRGLFCFFFGGGGGGGGREGGRGGREGGREGGWEGGRVGRGEVFLFVVCFVSYFFPFCLFFFFLLIGYYYPENISVIVAGMVEPEDLFASLQKIEQKIVKKEGERKERLDKGEEKNERQLPWVDKVPIYDKSSDQKVCF